MLRSRSLSPQRAPLLNRFDAAAGLRHHDICFLASGTVGTMRGRDVEVDLSTSRPSPIANVIDGQCHSVLNLSTALSHGLLFENIAWELVLQARTELLPAKVAIFGGDRLHEQVCGRGYTCWTSFHQSRVSGRADPEQQDRIHHHPGVSAEPVSQGCYEANHRFSPGAPAAAATDLVVSQRVRRP